jgi:iron complex outermembrane receptor protein
MLGLALVAALLPSAALAQQPAQPSAPPGSSFQERVEVVGLTPIDGIGLPPAKVPANVQLFSIDSLDASSAMDPASFLARRAVSVQVSDAQAGTFQPDLLFRGFVGSPLLGASEGLAVYQDGVRMNDPFGDTVAWDILPMPAIASINLIPGSNPMFGLNALGGALSLRTKDGFNHARHSVSFTTGAFGRHRLESESGGHGDGVAYYVAGTLTHDAGWRDFSPSTVRRIFGNGSWRGRSSSLGLSLNAVSNDLTGNGPAPFELLQADRSAVFTHPDIFQNDLVLLTMTGRRTLSSQSVFEGVAYYRRSSLRTLSGDAAEADTAAEFNAGVNNSSRTSGRGAGATAQITSARMVGGRQSHFIAGAGTDISWARFDSATELAQLTPDRGTIGTGIFDEEAFVDLHTRSVTGSAFVSETWSVTDAVAVTGAARFNWTALRLRDQLANDLNGDHDFGRINPSTGVTWQARPWLNVYGSYTQSSRVPSPVELTCADPEDPCRLPNAFVSDPPLDQVVARTWETGARGTKGPLEWSFAVYNSAVTDDIIFVSSGTRRGEGHFVNVERSRRRGVEAGIGYRLGDRAMAFASYSLQRATFGTPLTIASRLHPDAIDGEIAVDGSDRMPGVPLHNGKAGVTMNVTDRIQFGADVQAQSGLILRGDEANLLPEIPAFARLDARALYRITKRINVVTELNNLLDTSFYTFGVLGDPSMLGTGSDDPRFYSPGEPRSGWVGLEFHF